MASACSGMSEDHFLCSICLQVFTDPVTTSCGHNFCKSCISTHWGTSTTSKCPLCNQVFSTKPQLKVNTLLSQMISQFRYESEQKAAAPGAVPCDFCTGTKVKALKSCPELEKMKAQLRRLHFNLLQLILSLNAPPANED